MVQVWHWYVSAGTKMESMTLLFVSIGISGRFSSGASWSLTYYKCFFWCFDEWSLARPSFQAWFPILSCWVKLVL